MRHALELALVVVLAQSLGACGGRGAADEAEAAPAATVAAPAVALAVARELPETLVLDATLLADEESHVTPLVAGRVVEVRVERGDHVEEGAPLIRLRDAEYRLQSRTARSALTVSAARLGIDTDDPAPAPSDTPAVRSAAAELAVAEESLRRAEDLAGRGVFSAQQLDEARARAERAREAHVAASNEARAAVATLESARVTLAAASVALRDTTVTAPFTGEIAERSVSVGEYVAIATPLVTLVRTDPLRVEIVVPQERLSDVRVGQLVHVSVDAFADRAFDATVRYVSASVGRASRGLTVEAVLGNADGALRPGMFARVTLDLGRTRSIVAVPETAILTEAGVSRAFVIRDSAVVERIVEVLAREGAEVLVGDGLAAGDSVATERLGELADGLRLGD